MIEKSIVPSTEMLIDRNELCHTARPVNACLVEKEMNLLAWQLLDFNPNRIFLGLDG